MSYIVWIGFLDFVVLMVVLDLGVFHRKAHTLRVREALAWTGFWILLALAFNALVYFLYDNNWTWASTTAEQLSGRQAATQFFTGYVLEKSLSVDNIFVIALIFAYFQIPLAQQHRLLFWGIMGAVVLRGLMIVIGAALITRFEWVVYVFAVLLLLSAVKRMISGDERLDPNKNLAVSTDREDGLSRGAQFRTRATNMTTTVADVSQASQFTQGPFRFPLPRLRTGPPRPTTAATKAL